MQTLLCTVTITFWIQK